MGYENGVTLDIFRPGKPTDSPFIESFNGNLRYECLNSHWFLSMEDAREKIESWREVFVGRVMFHQPDSIITLHVRYALLIYLSVWTNVTRPSIYAHAFP